MNAFRQLSTDFQRSNPWLGLGLLLACIVLAYGIGRWFSRGVPRDRDSVWFGRSIVDGLLFPLLALVFAYSAHAVVQQYAPTFVLRIAVPVLASLAVIRLFARVLLTVFPHSPLSRLVERVVSWLAWLVAILWALGLLPAVQQQMASVTFMVGKHRLDLRTLVEGGFSAGVVLLLALWVSSAFERRILRGTVVDLSMRKVAANVVRSVLLLVGFLFALSAVGVDLTALSVLGGAVGVGLGFGLQKLASNYVSGFVILLERSLRIGDNIRIDTFEGRITDIKTRYTLVRAGNGREAIIPNESFITSRVENLTQADLKFNLTTELVVPHDSDPDEVQRLLVEAAAAQPRVLAAPAPVAYLLAFVPEGLQFQLNYWIEDPSGGQANVRSAVNLAVLRALRAAGIGMAAPQRLVLRDAEPAARPPAAAPGAGSDAQETAPARPADHNPPAPRESGPNHGQKPAA
jgi:small-conductance mechanosensitive channel